MDFRRMASIKTPRDFRDATARLGIEIPMDVVLESGPESPLAQPISWAGGTIGNRFAILPMEGWDATEDGRPSDLTIRRWRRFGASGAKLVWGGEAVAVRHDGRANPQQLLLTDANLVALESLRDNLQDAHRERFGTDEDLLVGLQLTHSGRFSRPNDKKTLEPRVAYRHPLLDAKFGLTQNASVLGDEEIALLVKDFGIAARRAQKIGFRFVDVKCCHGYLGHEFLSAVDRPGIYGGCFANRTRFFREVVQEIREQAPGLAIGVRLSIFDFLPFQKGEEGRGEPMEAPGDDYPYAFGGDRRSGLAVDLHEPSLFVDLLRSLGITLICTTAGNPYANPHLVRPATFPPSDGYLPPEDPLIGVSRQLNATAALKAMHPDLLWVGSAYSYLQEWLPHVAQAMVSSGGVDVVGIGRMALSYPDLPADVLAGRLLARKKICRTFSDCTTAPRLGQISGCYPLDEFYKNRPERELLPGNRLG